MFTNAKNPRWAGKNHDRILLDVQFTGEENYCNFVAALNDCTTHGPMLYNFALQGLFGEVQASDEERIIHGEIPPWEGYVVKGDQILNLAMYEQEAQAKLDALLAVYTSEEAKARAEIDAGYAAERKAKIAALLAVKQQPGWPLDVEWPLFG